MKCNFNSTPAMIAAEYILILVLIIGTGMLFKEEFKISVLVCYTLIIIGLIVVSNLKKGSIQTDEESVYISRSLFGHEVLKKSVAYYDIDTVECHADLETGRYGFIRYRLVTVIKENNSNERVFYTHLSIPKDMPVQNPEKYKKIIEIHPMMKLCAHINRKVKEFSTRE